MKLKLAALLLLTMLTGCGGGGGESGPSINGDNPGGVWNGAITGAYGGNANGIITQAGEGYFVDDASNVYRIRGGSVNGNNFTASVTVMRNNLDGSPTVATGRFTGTIVEASTLSGTYNIAGATGAFSFTYNASAYELTPTLASITGAYAFYVPVDSGSTILTVRITNTGAITVDQIPGCTGTLSIPFNGYSTVLYSMSGGCGASGITGVGAFIPGSGNLAMELDDGATFSVQGYANKGSASGGGSTAGGSTAGGSTTGGSTAGSTTSGGSTTGGSTIGGGGSTTGGSTAGGSTAGGGSPGGSTTGGSTAGGLLGGGLGMNADEIIRNGGTGTIPA